MESPGTLFIQLRSTALELSRLMEDLDKFYTDRTKEKLSLKVIRPGIVGMVFAATCL